MIDQKLHISSETWPHFIINRLRLFFLPLLCTIFARTNDNQNGTISKHNHGQHLRPARNGEGRRLP